MQRARVALGAFGLIVGRRWAAPAWLISLVANVPYAYFALVPGKRIGDSAWGPS